MALRNPALLALVLLFAQAARFKSAKSRKRSTSSQSSRGVLSSGPTTRPLASGRQKID